MTKSSLPPTFDSVDAIAAVIEAAPHGVVIVDPTGSIVLVNGELERMFGYPFGTLIGCSIEILIPERMREQHVGQRTQFLHAPTRRPMGSGRELFGRRADGTEFPLEIGLSSMSGPDGRLVVATVVDISARRESEETFRNIVEAAPYGMVMVDKTGVILVANTRIMHMFGYTRDELVGAQIDQLVPDRYRAVHGRQRTDYHRAPSLRAMGSGRDLMGRHKNGTEFPVEIGLSPAFWKGSVVSIAAVTDISVRKRLELELREANAQLEEFTYVASHDLKSPLRGIGDLVEWLSEDLGTGAPDGVRHNLDRIRTRVQRLEQIIDDLLTFARARNKTTDLTSIVPEDLIKLVVELEAPPSGFELHIDAPAAPFKVARTPLETVLRNLISNAIKHHDRPNGKISVSAIDDDAHCHFTVSDDGPGIPPQSQERVFRLFQTLSNAERRGSGIGLALTKRLVEAHGGRIALMSEEGSRGSTFHVWWPRFERRGADD